jgi:Flp pilus assembly protein TadD
MGTMNYINKRYTGKIRCSHVYLLIALLLLIPALLSCKKEAPKDNQAPARVLNSASNSSIFDEVKKKVDQNPGDAEALYHLADLYDRNEQYAEAVETYKKVVALKPDMGYAYFKMGTAYDRINQPAEAVAAFKKAVTLMPKNAVAYNNLGVALGRMGKNEEEIEALQKAIKIRPSYSSARFNLGMTYLKTGRKKDAMKEYEALKKFDEGVAEALMKEINSAS